MEFTKGCIMTNTFYKITQRKFNKKPNISPLPSILPSPPSSFPRLQDVDRARTMLGGSPSFQLLVRGFPPVPFLHAVIKVRMLLFGGGSTLPPLSGCAMG